jgi:hypothetical protein
VPLTIFSIKGLSGNRREPIQAAAVAGGKHARGPNQGWIAGTPRGTVHVLLTRPDGFERSVGFGPDEEAAVISEMVRATLEE